MAASRHRHSAGAKIMADKSGQAAAEFAVVVTAVLVLLFGLIDFGRALNYEQVMVGLTRQGSNTASRGTTLPTTAAALVAATAPLNVATSGKVIVTSVAQVQNTNQITGQASSGGVPCASHIGNAVGGAATIPPAAATITAAGQTIYVTEVCYSYQPITPIGNFIKNMVMPSTLYEVAYF